MRQRREQRGLRPTVGLSVFGDGLLTRLRSTSLALLGLITAVGLSMTALALNQDWSPITASPIPNPPAAAVRARPASEKPSPAVRRERPSAVVAMPPRSASPFVEVPGESPIVQPGTQVAVSTPTAAGHGEHRAPHDVSHSAPQPPPAPTEPAPSPVDVVSPPPPPESLPTAEPPPPEAVAFSHPGQGNAFGKGNGNGPPGGMPPGQVGK